MADESLDVTKLWRTSYEAIVLETEEILKTAGQEAVEKYRPYFENIARLGAHFAQDLVVTGDTAKAKERMAWLSTETKALVILLRSDGLETTAMIVDAVLPRLATFLAAVLRGLIPI